MKPGESRTKDNSMAFSSFISVFVGAALNSTVANVSSEQSPSSALLTHPNRFDDRSACEGLLGPRNRKRAGFGCNQWEPKVIGAKKQSAVVENEFEFNYKRSGRIG